MIQALRFIWNATRGYRLTPWRSPYIKWRVETYSGMKAEKITLQQMVLFVWREKRQLVHFLAWIGQTRHKVERLTR